MKQTIAISGLIALVLIFAQTGTVSASVPPEPTYGTAHVDGNYGEWNLANDFFANMYRAGDPTKELEAKAYIRYDCRSPATVYVLVLTENAIPALSTGWEAAAWTSLPPSSTKVYTGASGNNGNPPDFEWVEPGYLGNASWAKGYEASFLLNPGNYKIVVHIEVYDDGAATDPKPQTAATVGFPRTGTDFNLSCTNPYEVSKTVDTTTFTRTYDWKINKTVTPLHWDMFRGDSITPTYTVGVTKDAGTDSNWAISGTITITNPSTTKDFDILSVTDTITPSGTVAQVNCPSGYFLPHGQTLTCTYTANLPNGLQTTNTANVVTTSGTNTTSTSIAFGEPTTKVLDTINVADGSVLLPFSNTGSQDYTSTKYTCDANVGNNVNTATITETGKWASATFSLDCYHLDLTKWANTSADRTYDWTIAKSVDQSSLILQTGQQNTVNYNIVVNSLTFTDSNLRVNGEIHVNNRGKIPANITSVSDMIDPNIAGTVTCPVPFPIVLQAGSELVCTYTADSPTGTAGINHGTVTIQNHDYDSAGVGTPSGTTDFSNTASYNFNNPTLTEIDECITVTDSFYGLLGTVCHNNQLPKTFTYPSSIGPYPASGTYTVDNIASFTTGDTGTTGSNTSSVSVNVPSGGCTLTVGYWKTHSSYGPAPYDDGWLLIRDVDRDGFVEGATETFNLSGQTYYQVLWTNPGGNPYYILAWQYIPAKLNIVNGVGAPTQVLSAIAYAETFFRTYTPKSKLSKTESQMAISWAAVLANYNVGNLGYPHCTEQTV